LNKSDKRGAMDALRDVKKQYKRNHNLWNTEDTDLQIFGTIASQFNDPGLNDLYVALVTLLNRKLGFRFETKLEPGYGSPEQTPIIPPSRVRYLSEIAETNRGYDQWVNEQKEVAQQLFGIHKTMAVLETSNSYPKNSIVSSPRSM